MDPNDPIAIRCRQMSDSDLVRALTCDREDYDDTFLEQATLEIEARKVSVEAFLDRVTIAKGAGDPVDTTIDAITGELSGDVAPWELYIVTNSFDETVVVQKELSGWTVHEYDGDTYLHSFFSDDGPGDVGRFLKSSPDLSPETFNLDEWVVLEQTESTVFLRRLVAELDESGVPNTVQPPAVLGDPEGPYTVRIPSSQLRAGQDAFDRLDQRILELHRKAETLADGDNRSAELEIYNLLTELELESPAVWYNRGAVLLELGRVEDAAKSFVEAVTVSLDEEGRTLVPKRRAGGFLGLLGGQGEPGAHVPDHLEDLQLQMAGILESHPESMELLECLASVTRELGQWDEAGSYYERIIEIEPDHEAALSGLATLPAPEDS